MIAPLLLAVLTVSATGADVEVDLSELGEASALSQREPTLTGINVEVDVQYGLVGSGPTTLTTDIRLSLTDWFELRTAIVPQFAGLIARLKVGSTLGPTGAFVLDGGLSGLELGFDDGPLLRTYWEAGLLWRKALGSRLAVQASTRARFRTSGADDDDEQIFAGDARIIWDLPGRVSLLGGIAGASSLGPVRENSVTFVEPSSFGISHYLVELDEETLSVTLPVGLSYGLSDRFDVDVFITPRIYPKLDAILGAGIRWRAF